MLGLIEGTFNEATLSNYINILFRLHIVIVLLLVPWFPSQLLMDSDWCSLYNHSHRFFSIPSCSNGFRLGHLLLRDYFHHGILNIRMLFQGEKTKTLLYLDASTASDV